MSTSEFEILKSEDDYIFLDDVFASACNSPKSIQDDDNNEKSDDGIPAEVTELCACLEEEEERLKELDERRKKLENDMNKLQEELEEEKRQFRQAIDEEISRKRTIDFTKDIESDEELSKLDPLSLRKDLIESQLDEYREAMKENHTTMTPYEGDEDITRLRANLETYRKALQDNKRDTSEKKKAAAKIFQKHLDEVDVRCSAQIEKLANLQKDLENIGVSRDVD